MQRKRRARSRSEELLRREGNSYERALRGPGSTAPLTASAASCRKDSSRFGLCHAEMPGPSPSSPAQARNFVELQRTDVLSLQSKADMSFWVISFLRKKDFFFLNFSLPCPRKRWEDPYTRIPTHTNVANQVGSAPDT